MINISADAYIKDVAELAKQIDASKYKNIYGIPRGGVLVALELSKHLGLPVADDPTEDSLIVDDLIDSGRTLAIYPNHDTAVIYRKKNSPKLETFCAREVDGWIVFFYDKKDFDLDDNVVRILQYLGEDAAREGLRDTPKKYLELLNNYLSPQELVINTTVALSNKLISYEDIAFMSLCEGHLMPILGKVSVAFAPSSKKMSLQEVTKIIDWCSRRLQNQQQLTDQIAAKLQAELSPVGLSVTVTARHICSEMSDITGAHSDVVTVKAFGVLDSE